MSTPRSITPPATGSRMPPPCSRKRGRSAARPIFVGGTGLYFKALTHGLSAVPPIPAAVRDGVRARLERDGIEALHAELARRDPASAERLKPRDRARIFPRARSRRGHRAFAHRLASRRTAAAAAAGTIPRTVSQPRTRGALCADRRPVRRDAGGRRARRGGGPGGAAARSAAAGDEGAWRAGADPASARRDSPWRRPSTIGRADTRHYAKRQFTWFRHQLPEFEWMAPDAAREWLDEPSLRR